MFKSVTKTPHKHSEFCSKIPYLINLFHLYFMRKTDTTQASFPHVKFNEEFRSVVTDVPVESRHAVLVLTTYDTIVIIGELLSHTRPTAISQSILSPNLQFTKKSFSQLFHCGWK